jgi:hypothetical protein
MHALRSEEIHLLSVLGEGADKIGDDATGGREEKIDLGQRWMNTIGGDVSQEAVRKKRSWS